MGQHCPKCEASLTWKQLKREFPCPTCGAALKSNAISIMSWVGLVVGWTVFTIGMMGPEWAVYVGLVIAAGVIAATGAAFATVEAAGKEDAT